MLVGCGSGRETAAIHSSLTELERLAHTAGATVVDTVIQHRDAPDPGWMIGRGKVEELAQTVEEERIDLILFDRELSRFSWSTWNAGFPARCWTEPS